MTDLNLSVFEAINGLSSNPIISSIAQIIADFPIFFLPLFLAGMWLYYTYSPLSGILSPLEEKGATEKLQPHFSPKGENCM
ncbi:hypothetical protein N9J72_03100, partial [Candidatus Gracilibacteria bacterium]|nr:hypothetical protein [Candidatus Gracilibacteria bacterium]